MLRRKRRRLDDDDDADEDVVVETLEPSTIFYRGEIREPHATAFCKALRKMMQTLAGTNCIINVFLNSAGGDAYAGLSMYEHVRMVGRSVPVHVTVDGYIASAATLPLLGATRRIMCSTAFMMIHEVRTGTYGKPHELRQESDNINKLMEVFVRVYQTYSTLNRAKLLKILSQEIDFSASECLEMGLVDQVV